MSARSPRTARARKPPCLERAGDGGGFGEVQLAAERTEPRLFSQDDILDSFFRSRATNVQNRPLFLARKNTELGGFPRKTRSFATLTAKTLWTFSAKSLQYRFLHPCGGGLSALRQWPAASIGTYVVCRRLVFLSGGITHASFGGIGMAYYFGADPVTGGVCCSPFCLGAGHRSRSRPGNSIREDSAIGLLWSLGMAVGIIFIYLTPGYAPNLMSFPVRQYPERDRASASCCGWDVDRPGRTADVRTDVLPSGAVTWPSTADFAAGARTCPHGRSATQ